MSKIKMSRGDVFRRWPRVWSLGYCEMSGPLRLLGGPRGYACGVYGWNYDIYDVGGVAVCTGYRDTCRGWTFRAGSSRSGRSGRGACRRSVSRIMRDTSGRDVKGARRIVRTAAAVDNGERVR